MLHSLRHAVGSRRLRRPTLLVACLGALAILAGPATASSYTILTNGTPLQVTTTTGGENANLTFAGTAGNRISIRIYGVTMSPKPNTGIKVSIQKPDGSTLVSPFDVGSAGTFIEPVSTPVTGNYKLVLDGQSTYKGKATVAIWTVATTRPAPRRPAAQPCRSRCPRRARTAASRSPATAGQRVSLKLSPRHDQRQRDQLGAGLGAEARRVRARRELELRELGGVSRALHDPGQRQLHGQDRPAPVVLRLGDSDRSTTSPPTRPARSPRARRSR